ncbi:MAG: SprT family zinc-dependent metalloprotease [Gammaproteobacteria bacterium]|nr:MAG: SprT family zinc-dependent metalloprotease [Gammaproteobacteria bacterium]
MAGRSIATALELDIDGDSFGYTLHRVVGRKHVHLVVDEDARLQVRAPWRFSRESAAEVVIENLLWVRDALERAMRTRVERAPLVSGTHLPLLDEELRLELRVAAQMDLLTPVDRGRVTAKVRDALGTRDGWIARRGGVLQVVSLSLTQAAQRPLVEAWYRREAKRRLPARLAPYARTLGVTPARISIRAQRTRWGSCSSRGTICLNWRLLLLPAELCDYILVHELCHLRHLDHSARFWGLVGSVIPDYAEREGRLESVRGQI